MQQMGPYMGIYIWRDYIQMYYFCQKIDELFLVVAYIRGFTVGCSEQYCNRRGKNRPLHICAKCNRVCRSRIGFISHERSDRS